MFKYTLLVVSLCVYKISCSTTTTINFHDSCTYTIYNPNEDQSYYLVWDGHKVDFSYCSMGFKGKGSDIFDEYKICVEPVSFYISCSDVGVTVKYEEGLSSVQKRNYSCGSYPVKWCSDSDEYVDIILSNANSYGSLSGYSSFKLKITAIKTYDQMAVVGGIVGGVIGGIVLIIMVVVGFGIITKRRRTVTLSHNVYSRPQLSSINTAPQSTTHPSQQSPYPSTGFASQHYSAYGTGQYNTQYSNYDQGPYTSTSQYPSAPPAYS